MLFSPILKMEESKALEYLKRYKGKEVEVITG